MNKAAINIHMKVLVWISVLKSLGKYLGVQLLDSPGDTRFSFVRNYQTLFQVGCAVYISTSSKSEFLLLHTLLETGIVSFLDFLHADRHVVVCHHFLLFLFEVFILYWSIVG